MSTSQGGQGEGKVTVIPDAATLVHNFVINGGPRTAQSWRFRSNPRVPRPSTLTRTCYRPPKRLIIKGRTTRRPRAGNGAVKSRISKSLRSRTRSCKRRRRNCEGRTPSCRGRMATLQRSWRIWRRPTFPATPSTIATAPRGAQACRRYVATGPTRRHSAPSLAQPCCPTAPRFKALAKGRSPTVLGIRMAPQQREPRRLLGRIPSHTATRSCRRCG